MRLPCPALHPKFSMRCRHQIMHDGPHSGLGARRQRVEWPNPHSTGFTKRLPNAQNCTTLPTDSEARKAYPLFRGPLRYFPAAIAAVANLCKLGNDKHNPGEEMHHARGKSTDHADCIMRHLMDMSEDFGHGVGRDENGVPQVVMIAWRALALAQEWLENNDGKPFAPGARR